MERLDVSFSSGGATCAAWLYLPSCGTHSLPGVALAHGFTGTRRDRLGAFAERFAAAGIAALVFDYRGFGDSEGHPPDVVDPGAQLADWRAALAYLRARPEIDPTRVAAWGTSMGGGHVLMVAAGDPALRAAVSQVPCVDMVVQARALRPRVAAALTAHGLLDRARARLDLAPHVVPAVGPDGATAFISAPGAEAGWLRVVAAGEDSRWRNRAAARVALDLAYRPIKRVREVRCPVLFCVGTQDRVTPPAAAIAAARRTPRGVLRTYPIDHFDVYLGAPFERAVADQIDFLGRHLLGAAASDVARESVAV